MKIDSIKEAIKLSRRLREKFMNDLHRPRYHFAMIDGLCLPGDPNCAFYKDGVYHLMYLYNKKEQNPKDFWDANFCFGHISSIDLVHWRHHPDAIVAGDGDGGCFSGGAFVDDDGTAYITYWSLPISRGVVDGTGIGIAKSSDKMFEKWEKISPLPIPGTEFGAIKVSDENGNDKYISNADPSNIWKSNGYYYLQSGNLPILNKYGRDDDSPQELKGDWVDLFKSKDLLKWEYVHRFYDRNESNIWTDESEDDMCPSFMPLPMSKDGGELSGKYLQLFISHNKGCQYYIGEYDRENQKFLPEKHGRMSWKDNSFFAPEALMDGNNRQIMWAWILDYKTKSEDDHIADGWTGVYGVPRTLWLNEKGELGIAPVNELKLLRYNEKSYSDCTIKGDSSELLCDVDGLSHEINLTIDPKSSKTVGLKICTSKDFSEYTSLYYDKANGSLLVDSTNSGKLGINKRIEEAPFKLSDGEKLELQIFIDKSIIEIFANNRQAITRRVFPSCDNCTSVFLNAEGGSAEFSKIKIWEMAASNPY